GNESITVVGTGADAPAPRLREDDMKILERANKEFGTPKSPIKGFEEKNEKKIPSSTGEEYVIKQGDTFETIAKDKFGSTSYASKIAEANPGVKATSLRVGKTIVLPSKNEKKEESAVAQNPVPAGTVDPVVIKKP